jgi:hypothetical protein
MPAQAKNGGAVARGVAGALPGICGGVCAVELKMLIAGVRLLLLHGRAGWRDLPSPQERSDSPRGRRDCADRSRRSPGVWIAAPLHPLRRTRSMASRGLSCLEDEGGGSRLQSRLGARLARLRLPAVQASSKPRMRSVLHPVCVVIPTQ